MATETYAQRYYRLNKERLKDRMRESYFKRRYGITVQDYEELLQAQDGKCALCGGITEANGLLYVDHSHRTGKVRALLCNSCNVALGLFKDDPALMRAAADYVERFNGD